jgi:hypothetical protein
MGWLGGYSYRQKITIDADSYIASDLTDFSVRVNIPSSNTDFWTNDDGDGSYVRFTSSDGVTLLNFEVESYDNSGEDAWWHVKVPTLSGTVDTEIYIYYKAASPSSGENIAGTWDSNYVAVYHLNQDKAAGAFADSTSNAINGTNAGTTNRTGYIDNGRDFDGVDDGIELGYGNFATALNGAAGVTMSCVIEPDVFMSGGAMNLFWSREAGADFNFFSCRIRDLSSPTTMKVDFSARSQSTDAVQSGDTSTTAITAGNKYFLVYIADFANDLMLAYQDGVEVTNKAVTFGSSTYVKGSETPAGLDRIGRYPGSNFFNGGIDDMRVSSKVRDSDWVQAEYRNWLGAWMTISAQESAPPRGAGERGIGRGIMRGVGRGI